MSFDKRFDSRWNNVIKPALSLVRFNNVPLEPHRVDLTKASDSILTEILDNIGRCRVFVADITALDQVNNRAIRNQNVFYEIGLVHATRLPEEVLLFRSDDFELTFDISNVRVHHYDPDGNPEESRKIIISTVTNSLNELDLKRNLAIRQAMERLDEFSLDILLEAASEGSVIYQPRKTSVLVSIDDRLNTINRLLDLGAIQLNLEVFKAQLNMIAKQNLSATELSKKLNRQLEEGYRYYLTPFGAVLIEYCVEEAGLSKEYINNMLRKCLKSQSEASLRSMSLTIAA